MHTLEFSDFGTKLTAHSGILQLMDDIGKPFPPDMKVYKFGGGNPACIPEIAAMYNNRMSEILDSESEFSNLLGLYDAPGGRVSFIEAIASFFSRKYGWNIGPENVAVLNGSQSAFFYLFNLFGGTVTKNGKTVKKTIVFPLVPEYIGYADQGIEPDTFVGIPADFTKLSEHSYKYAVNFTVLEDYLKTHDTVGALCVTRPTNPTGNVLTDEEIEHLHQLAVTYDIPLMIDNAYGLPWPDIIFTNDAKPYWNDNVILSMSMSKIGLPSVRTGIVIAQKEVITALGNINAIAALTTASFGQALSETLIRDGSLVKAAEQYVRPFYQKKSETMQQMIMHYFGDGDYLIHKSEGSIFLWLLMNDLRITTKEFYAILKERGVVVVPGEYFFFGNAADGCLPPVEQHPHYTKCLRLNYSRPDEEVEAGIRIIAEEYHKYSLA